MTKSIDNARPLTVTAAQADVVSQPVVLPTEHTSAHTTQVWLPGGVADGSRPRLQPETVTSLPPGVEPWFTVVVPTRNESGNVGPLLSDLAQGLAGVVAEVLFVDDSTDDTVELIRFFGRVSGLPVRVLHREVGAGGLSGAVVEGLRLARGTWAVVMDGDLQHPPQLVGDLVRVGASRGLDLVAATRKLGNGQADGLAGGYRHAASALATFGAKFLFPRRLARLSDPMSGFFAVRLAALDLDRLRPVGFKILLEIAVRRPGLLIAEVPFVFGERLEGNSKASVREGLRFLRHITRLRLDVLKGQVKKSSKQSKATRLRKLVTFGLVGASGLAVNTGALYLFSGWSHYLIAAVLATQVSTTWNWVFTELLVFSGVKPGTKLSRGIKFFLLNNLALVIRLPILALLVGPLGINLLIANIFTLVLLFLVRFLIADAAIYAKPSPDVVERRPMRVVVSPMASLRPVGASPARPLAPGARHLPYRYSIHGLLTVGSHVPLPELEYFRDQRVGNNVDLAIRVGKVGRGAPRARAQMTQFSGPSGLQYEEHLGRLGANFSVDIGEKIDVVCSSALARSPHVLYTNVIEALLRFITVSRGSVLLHSACMELDGHGFLLSARTDTGKTGTVLRMVRDFGAQFLSDDMTIIDSTGVARCFPKPLTISHHTLRAVQAGDLTAAEWRRLKIQSRLHSKEGRDFGMILARLNIPIMGFNSMVQRVVPPPKFTVDRLVETTIARQTTVRDLFVIERGPHALTDIPFQEGLETLVVNTDDAYGFPPFREMAPSIVIGEDDYAQLRLKERDILASAVSQVRVRGLATPDFTWADNIAKLLADEKTRAIA